ncbi:MAG: hypothetical protein AABY32_04245 [Nanoarchaeota archaeon]
MSWYNPENIKTPMIKTASKKRKTILLGDLQKLMSGVNININFNMDGDSVEIEDESVESQSNQSVVYSNNDPHKAIQSLVSNDIKSSKAIRSLVARNESKESNNNEYSYTIQFISVNKRDANYLGSVSMREIEEKFIVVTCYISETYLGQYAYRKDCYFDKDNIEYAKECYSNIINKLEDVKKSYYKEGYHTVEIPKKIKKVIDDMKGDYDRNDDHISNYLNTDVQDKKGDITVKVPQRSMRDELDIPTQRK